jgi:hypothetical protein
MWQNVLVALLVTGASVYAAWALMPRALRSKLFAGRYAQRSPSGGCDQCAAAPQTHSRMERKP